MGRTCREPNEIELPAMGVKLNGSRCRPRLVSQRTNATNATTIVSSSDVVSQVFARPLAGGELAVVLLNRDEASARLSVSWAELGLAAGAKMHVRDVTNQKDLPTASDTWGATVGKHDVAFIRLSPSS